MRLIYSLDGRRGVTLLQRSARLRDFFRGVILCTNMATRTIVRFPDPKLRQRSAEIGVVDDGLRQLVADMAETMVAAEGAGLAAIQVGAPVRLFIVDGHVAGGAEDAPAKVFINPEIVAISDEAQTGDEGCLSFPNIFVAVKRGMRARVRAMDLDGQTFEAEGGGPLCPGDPARDRSPERQAAHRSGRTGQARDHQAEAAQGPRSRTGRGCRAAAGARGAVAGAGSKSPSPRIERLHADHRAGADRVRRASRQHRHRTALDAQVRGRRGAGRRRGRRRAERFAWPIRSTTARSRSSSSASARGSRTICSNRWPVA